MESNFVESWFPGGKNDPNLLILRMELGDASIWSGELGVLATAKMALGDERPRRGCREARRNRALIARTAKRAAPSRERPFNSLGLAPPGDRRARASAGPAAADPRSSSWTSMIPRPDMAAAAAVAEVDHQPDDRPDRQEQIAACTTG